MLNRDRHNKTLACDHKYIDLYIKSRHEFYGDGQSSALFRLPRGQTELFYDMALKTQSSILLIYELHEQCGIEFRIEYPSQRYIDQVILPYKQKQQPNKQQEEGLPSWTTTY
jgi:hypothetical protein